MQCALHLGTAFMVGPQTSDYIATLTTNTNVVYLKVYLVRYQRLGRFERL